MKTMVLERNTYGRGVHRFHAGFLDYAKHAGFLPRLCQPYRARTKGKVARFVGYLKGSFWVPFVASMRQLGLAPDKHVANGRGLAVAARSGERARARDHWRAPAERLLTERVRLQTLPAAYGGRSARIRDTGGVRKAVLGYQHPLAVYELEEVLKGERDARRVRAREMLTRIAGFPAAQDARGL